MDTVTGQGQGQEPKPVQTASAYPPFATKAERLEFFRLKLKTVDAWAIRACEVIYGYQTASEKSAQETVQDNGVGFSGTDAKLLSSFAQQIGKNRAAQAAGNMKKGYGLLSPKQLAVLHKIMPKYAQQLVNHLEVNGNLPAIAKKAVSESRAA